jgi:hypothetical protein
MITTHFRESKHLLLTDNNNKGIAVISCNPNENITSKVERAIREDMDADSAIVLSDVEMQYGDVEFLVSITLSDDCVFFDTTFYLIEIAVY